MIASRQLPHIYQQLYHSFSQRPNHHHEGMEKYNRSTQMGEEEEEVEGDAVGVFKEAVEYEGKEIETKVKMELT